MRLRRGHEGTAPTTTATGREAGTWDGLPVRWGAELVIRAPRAGDLVAEAVPAPASAPSPAPSRRAPRKRLAA